MARVQYGTIVTEIKGKVQGQVFQGGNVGFLLRNKGYTKGIASTARNEANQKLSANASAWRSLTDTQRGQWAALAPDWLFYNKFGASYQGSGFQIYMSYNGYRNLGGYPSVDEPGVIDPPTNPGLIELAGLYPDGLEITCENEGTNDMWYTVYASAPVSAGRNTNNLRLKKIATIYGLDWDVAEIGTLYSNVYGIAQVGQRVTVVLIFYNSAFPYPYYRTVLTGIVQPTP